MQNNLKSDEILNKVLEIIGFGDDRESFVQKFLENCHKLALQDFIKSLPEETQAEIEKLTDDPASPENAQKFKEILETSNYKDFLEKATSTLFGEFLEAITPSLSQDQKNELREYLTSIA
jgi:hypothetical protein